MDNPAHTEPFGKTLHIPDNMVDTSVKDIIDVFNQEEDASCVTMNIWHEKAIDFLKEGAVICGDTLLLTRFGQKGIKKKRD